MTFLAGVATGAVTFAGLVVWDRWRTEYHGKESH